MIGQNQSTARFLIAAKQDDTTGHLDFLLSGVSNTLKYQRLRQWCESTTELHEFPIDYRRLQIEYWVWSHKEHLFDKKVVDIGVEIPRKWVGDGYVTFGERDCDVIGDVTTFPFDPDSLDAVICTEVLEHVLNPFEAVSSIRRALKPGGLFIVTSPFIHPFHGTDQYNDYWRFTHQGWQVLLDSFRDVKIVACDLTDEAKPLFDLIRRFESWGFPESNESTTGYLCRAVK